MHNLSMLTFPSAPLPQSRAAPAARPRRAPKVNRLLQTLKFHSDFSQVSQNPPRTFPVHDTIHIPKSFFQSRIFILTSLNDKSLPRARVNTYAHVAPN